MPEIARPIATPPPPAVPEPPAAPEPAAGRDVTATEALPPAETTRRLDELTFLAEVARVMASARTFEELMGTILDRARAAARADVCSLYLMDRDRAGLTLAATDGLDQEAVGRAWLGLGEGLTGLAARQRSPITSVDVNVDPRFAWIREVDQARYTSMCSVPLLWGDEVVGVLNVQTIERREFGPADVDFLETLAGLLAGTLEKQRLQQEAVAQVEALRAIDEARANLIAVVTHALRTPLAVVRAYVELLGGRVQATEQPDAAVWESEALTQVDRLDRTVDSILDSLRVFPNARVELARLDLAALVQEEARILSPMLRRHTLETTFRDDPLLAWGSDEMLRRLLGYMLENASKYAPVGGTIDIYGWQWDGLAHIAVTDDGPGIPREWRERIFEPFVRLDDSPRGAGIGLFAARHLARAMHGDLVVEDREPAGSQFVLTLRQTRPEPAV
ncbi:MAG: GAF domain-containing sensor histidine kinase [Chloroflexi bacterium]|nr:GAF domain-containing sensor histidine kinase [Chloroflexota bacterium]